MEFTDRLLTLVLKMNNGQPVNSLAEAYFVVRSIATNPDTPADVLDLLSYHTHEDIVERVAENSACPRHTLTRLADYPATCVRAAVANNDNVDRDTLMKLVQDASLDVRYSIAENPRLPRDVIEILTSDENPYIASRAHCTLRKLKAIGRFGKLLNLVIGRRSSRATG